MKLYYALVMLCLGTSLYGMDAEAVKEQIFENPSAVTYDEIRGYLQTFPDFMTWKNASSSSFLHALAWHGLNRKIAVLLLGQGPDLAFKNAVNLTVRDIAERAGNEEMLAVLNAYGNNSWTTDPQTGETTYSKEASVGENPFAQDPVRNPDECDKPGWFGSISSYATAKNLLIAGIGSVMIHLAWKKYAPLLKHASKD